MDLPETLRYRLKNVLLGPPIASDRQSSERLGKPTALAVLSSDVISSSAYATEQMLIPLVIAIGAAAYSLVIPVTIAVIFVLLFVTLSYLEVVKVYTKAGRRLCREPARISGSPWPRSRPCPCSSTTR